MRCALSQIWQRNYGEWIPCHPDDPLFIQYNMIQNEVELCEIQSLLFSRSLVCRTIDLGTGCKRADSRHDFFPFIHFLSATQDFFSPILWVQWCQLKHSSSKEMLVQYFGYILDLVTFCVVQVWITLLAVLCVFAPHTSEFAERISVCSKVEFIV